MPIPVIDQGNKTQVQFNPILREIILYYPNPIYIISNTRITVVKPCAITWIDVAVILGRYISRKIRR